MIDRGLAAERTALARRRTTLPFLVVALLGARAALDVPVQGVLVALVAAAGAVTARAGSPRLLTAVVLALAAAAAALSPPEAAT